MKSYHVILEHNGYNVLFICAAYNARELKEALDASEYKDDAIVSVQIMGI